MSELKSASFQKIENKKIISKINFINNNYEKTGHIILKDEILLEWFYRLTFSESMFGATELLFIIKDNIPIDIKTNKKSKICIDICSTKDDIPPYLIYKYIKFNHKKEEENFELSEKIFKNKIYEELSEGNYQLSFEIVNQEYKDSLRCRIKYYQEDIEITEKEEMESIINFSKVNQYNEVCKYIINLINQNEFIYNDNIEYLPDNPEDNYINIDYNNNSKLYWVEDNDNFENFNYKIYSMNYIDFTVMTIINLLYFVPVCKIICDKNKNIYKVITPGNESFVMDKNMNIIKISNGLKNFPTINNNYENSLRSTSTNELKKKIYDILIVLVFIIPICIIIDYTFSYIISASINIFYFIKEFSLSIARTLWEAFEYIVKLFQNTVSQISESY